MIRPFGFTCRLNMLNERRQVDSFPIRLIGKDFGVARHVLGACAVAFALALPGAAFSQPAGNPARDPGALGGELRLRGSNTVGAELAPGLVIAFGRKAGLTSVRTVEGSEAETHTVIMETAETERQLRAEIAAQGTGTAFPALRDKLADIGMASRPVTEAERAAVAAAGLGDLSAPGNMTPISLDGVVVLVNPDNPVSRLTLAQLRAVFTGAVTNWSALGGKDIPISLYRRDEASGTFDTFRALALGGAAIAPTSRKFESSADLADAVASDPGGIGFAGFAYVRNARAVALGLACGMTLPPTQFQVRTEEYPLSRRLMLYTPAAKPPLVQEFLRFATSEAAQPIVEKSGFVSFTPEVAAAADRATRLQSFALGTSASTAAKSKTAEFTRMTDGWHRLSTTFRFELGGAGLDARGRDDIGRLAAWMKREKRPFMLVGYASGTGSFASNVALSLRRAQEVGAQLAASGARPRSVTGMGIMGPVACNDDAGSGSLNRRVEVWVK